LARGLGFGRLVTKRIGLKSLPKGVIPRQFNSLVRVKIGILDKILMRNILGKNLGGRIILVIPIWGLTQLGARGFAKGELASS